MLQFTWIESLEKRVIVLRRSKRQRRNMMNFQAFYFVLTPGEVVVMVVQTDGGEKFCQVLIIEDDQDDAFLIRRALNAAAAERNLTLGVTHAVNGLDALGSVARSDVLNRLPHVIIVDLNMPLVDGDRFLSALREDLQLGGTPAAVLTTSTEKPVHAKALASGADAVFCKPNTQEELVEIARRILDMGVPFAA